MTPPPIPSGFREVTSLSQASAVMWHLEDKWKHPLVDGWDRWDISYNASEIRIVPDYIYVFLAKN